MPDKDADGLTSGAILQQTLVLLDLHQDLISLHLVQKGSNIHAPAERTAMAAYKPSYVFVLDQGSRRAPPVVDDLSSDSSDGIKALIIDHHHVDSMSDFPEGAHVVTACQSPKPIATSSLLTYLICTPLAELVAPTCAWLAVVGTHGDLGTAFKWNPPFPDMAATLKLHTRKQLNEVVSLLNAPRRTAGYDVRSAWNTLVKCACICNNGYGTDGGGPEALVDNEFLLQARREVNAEVERCTHAAPKFSADGRIAVLRISSPAQVHPVIATRWAGHPKSSRLEVVMVANEGYLPGMVNFSCRVAKCAKARQGTGSVDIIKVLKEVADKAEDETLRARLGESFARGHKEASGGVVPKEEFEELIAVLEVGRRGGGGAGSAGGKKGASRGAGEVQNPITKYFGKKEES